MEQIIKKLNFIERQQLNNYIIEQIKENAAAVINDEAIKLAKAKEDRIAGSLSEAFFKALRNNRISEKRVEKISKDIEKFLNV